MSTVTLVSLPVEILYLICDYLDIWDILRSFRRVCKQLYAVSHAYNRYKLDMCSMSASNIKLISHRIPPEHIISLISHKYYNKNHFELPRSALGTFRSILDISQFTQLQSLTLIDVNDTDTQSFFEHIHLCQVR